MGELRAHEQILEALGGQIADGTLGVGDRPERLLRAVRGIDLVELREAAE